MKLHVSMLLKQVMKFKTVYEIQPFYKIQNGQNVTYIEMAEEEFCKYPRKNFAASQ